MRGESKMTLDRALGWFINGWIALVVLLTFMSFAGTIISAPTIWNGLGAVADELSPYDLKYYFTMALLLSPAILATWWRDRRREKSSNSD